VNRPLQPFRVIKETCHAAYPCFATFLFPLVVVLCVISLAPSASAEIKIKVIDPSEAAVAGAQVQLLKVGKSAPVAALSTSAEGIVIFREAIGSGYRVLVLAPGFAVEAADLSSRIFQPRVSPPSSFAWQRRRKPWS